MCSPAGAGRRVHNGGVDQPPPGRFGSNMVCGVVSLTRRYLSGEREEVWRELRRAGPVPIALRADAAAVAAETMRRVLGHVQRIVLAVQELDLQPAHATIALHTSP